MSAAQRSQGSCAADVVVTGIGVVCPGADSATEACDRRPVSVVDGSWFVAGDELGSRGNKYLPAPCRYLLVAAGRAVADATGWHDVATDDRRGCVVGTNAAGTAVHDDMDRTVAEGDADELSPASAPFFSINLYASLVSVRHHLKAFNLTVTTPLVAGLEAFEIGTRSVAIGRATTLVVGVTEGHLPTDAPGSGVWLPGAVAFVAEPRALAEARGAHAYGSCRVRTLFVPPLPGPSQHRAVQVKRAVDEAAADLGPGGGEVEQHHVVGELGPLAPLLLVAGLLATSDRHHLVVSTAPEGNVACALVAPPPAIADAAPWDAGDCSTVLGART